MPICKRCGKDVGLLGNLYGYYKKTSRCGKCEGEVQQALKEYRDRFLLYCKDSLLTPYYPCTLRIA